MKSLRALLVPIIFLAIFTINPSKVSAANKAHLSFKHINFDDSKIEVSIYLDTSNYKVNAVTADFTYPSNLLSVDTVQTKDSVFENFLEMDYSTEGVIFISAYSQEPVNTAGEVARILFDTISPGTASLQFTENTVVLDASSSSNILGDTEEATYTITENLDVLPETGQEANIISGLIFLMLLVMIVIFALLGFTLWGGIYFSLGKWKIESKYEVGIGKKKSKKGIKNKKRKTSTKKGSKKSTKKKTKVSTKKKPKKSTKKKTKK